VAATVERTIDAMSASDLDQLRAATCPRDAGLCDALTRRYEPGRATVVRLAWLLVAFGLAFAPATIVVTIATAATRGLYHPGAAPPWLLPLFLGTWAATFVLAWLALERYLRRRRQEIAALFREGKFVEAMPSGRSSFGTRAGALQRISFTFDGEARMYGFVIDFARDVDWPDKRALPILHREGSQLCATFPHADGRMMPRTLR
jgi:hypothetical protein